MLLQWQRDVILIDVNKLYNKGVGVSLLVKGSTHVMGTLISVGI